MRDRLLLAAVILGTAGTLAWGITALYLEPAQSADFRGKELATEVADLQLREREARSELAQAAVDQSAPLLASLVDPAPSAAIAAARLQEVARNTIVQFGGQPISSQSGSVELGGGYTKISLMLRARFDEPGLLGFLRQIESVTPVVLVETLDVQPLPIKGEARSLDVTANLAGIHTHVAAP